MDEDLSFESVIYLSGVRSTNNTIKAMGILFTGENCVIDHDKVVMNVTELEFGKCWSNG